jgi:hypothetical protein
MHSSYEFKQTPIFSVRLDATKDLGLLEKIEAEISKNPTGGALLRGGIRKIRVAPSERATGKSGGYRVLYFYQMPDVIHLLFLIDKRKAPNLTPDQEEFLIQGLKRVLDDVARERN